MLHVGVCSYISLRRSVLSSTLLSLPQDAKQPVQSILTNATEYSASYEANSSSPSQEIFEHFMEPEGSLTHSQKPATFPYPELDQYGP